MIAYRMKHLPTGLYFRPSTEVKITLGGHDHYVKTNLSKKGKIYSSKPTFNWIDPQFYNHVQFFNDKMIELLETGKSTFDGRWDRNSVYPFIEEDWIIEEL